MFIFSNINFVKKILEFDKVIKVLMKLPLSYSDKIQLFKLKQHSNLE